MSWKEVFVRLLTTPWLLASGAVVALLQLTGTAGLWEFISLLAAKWFGTAAIASGFIAPNVGWIPTDIVLGFVAVLALIVFVDKTDETIEWMREKYL